MVEAGPEVEVQVGGEGVFAEDLVLGVFGLGGRVFFVF